MYEQPTSTLPIDADQSKRPNSRPQFRSSQRSKIQFQKSKSAVSPGHTSKFKVAGVVPHVLKRRVQFPVLSPDG